MVFSRKGSRPPNHKLIFQVEFPVGTEQVVSTDIEGQEHLYLDAALRDQFSEAVFDSLEELLRKFGLRDPVHMRMDQLPQIIDFSD